MNLPSTLRRILQSGCSLVGASSGALGVVGYDGGLSTLVTFGDDELAHDHAGQDVLRRIASEGTTRRAAGEWAVLGTPVRAEGESVGALCLIGRLDEGKFTQHDEEIALATAEVAGGAIHSLAALELSRRREQWLAASLAITKAMLAGENPTATLHQVAKQARLAADASAGAIARPHGDDDSTLEFKIVDSRADTSSLVGLLIPIEGTATGRAFRTGRPVVVRSYGDRVVDQQRHVQDQLPAMIKDLDSAIAVPLITGGERIGALTVSRFIGAAPFTDEDVQLVESFAAHASLVYEFAKAEDDRRQLAIFEDRYRIASDLHDVVVQRLYATGLRMLAVSKKIDQPLLARDLTSLVSELDGAVQDIRSSVHALEEARSAPGSVRSALRQQVHGFSDVLGFEPWLRFDGPIDSVVPDDLVPDLYAAVNETLSNVARHASATSASVSVELDHEVGELTLTVIDNGVGIQGEASRHSGLANLEARAGRWGGALVVGPAPNRGTTVEWRVYLSGDGPARARRGTA